MASASNRGKRLRGLVLLRERGGDLFLDAWVVGKERFEPAPDLERLVVLLRPLVDAAEGLEDFKQIVTRRFSLERALESGGGLFGLTDQHQGLSEVVRRQAIIRARRLGLLKGRDGGGILSALAFEQTRGSASRCRRPGFLATRS